MSELGVGGYGSFGYGAGPWGSAVLTFELLSAEAVRENVVRLTFSAPPLFNRLRTPDDASSPLRYSFASRDATARPVAAFLVELVDGSPDALDVTVDRMLSGFPAPYTVEVEGLVSAELAYPLTGDTSADFFGLAAGVSPPTPEQLVANRDILTPFAARDAVDSGLPASTPLGAFVVDANGDYAAASPLASYRQRVYRRALSAVNGFAHLKGYGAGLGAMVKQAARPGLRERTAALIEQQVRLEPETVSVQVTVGTSAADQVVTYKVAAFARFGVATFNVKGR